MRAQACMRAAEPRGPWACGAGGPRCRMPVCAGLREWGCVRDFPCDKDADESTENPPELPCYARVTPL